MSDPTFLTIAIFLFALGACVGSFLNVVVYRLPKDMSLVSPPSTCPSCGHRLAAYDNVPVFGWLWLRGKCRYCRTPISPRYPIVELITGLLFLGHFLLLFYAGWGPYEVVDTVDRFGFLSESFRLPELERDWPILLLHLWLIASLLAASLIDLEHFIIPLGICWLTAIVGALAHTFGLQPGDLGSLHNDATIDALALGGGVGMILSLLLLRFGIFKRSFADDAPAMEHEVEHLPDDQKPDPWPASRIRKEMAKELLFLLPPVVFACAFAAIAMGQTTLASNWATLSAEPHVSGFLGSLLGALVGGAVVWFFRIAGSIGFGREAMGLGDVHLMFGVGAIIGAGASTVAFFLAPLFGLTIALIQLFLKGKREIPYGPYLSLATYALLLFYTPIRNYLAPGMAGLVIMVEGLLSGNGAT